MTDEKPFVTLIVPCRNEAKWIRPCLDSILDNDYPNDRLEIIIVDGMSVDGTRNLIQSYLTQPIVTLVDNPKLNVCAAMNLGLAQARGSVVFKMDAHAVYPRDYLTRCVLALQQSGAQNVGGRFIVRPGANTPLARSIALAVTHPFGIGWYYQWMSSLKVPTEVKTVSFGCFRKEFLDQNHLLFNENLERGGDSEFNARLRQCGGKIILFPDIILDYHGRATLKGVGKHQFSCGFWNLYGSKFGTKITLRALTPILTVLILTGLMAYSFVSPGASLLAGGAAVLYMALNLFYSSWLALKSRNAVYFLILPITFAILHLSFALGSLYGVLKMWGLGREWLFKPEWGPLLKQKAAK